MDIRTTVLNVLTDLTGEDLTARGGEDLFATGLLDSMATVQLLLELQDQLGIAVPVSEFDRSEWATADKIVAKATSLA